MASTIQQLTQTVATSGTAVQLSTIPLPVAAFWLMAKKVAGSNTGNVFIGLSDVDKATKQILQLSPGDYWEPIMRRPVDLSEVYMDADNNGDGVVVLYQHE